MGQQGFYRDPPSRRMAYDTDGSIMVKVTPTNTIHEFTTNNKIYNNSEDDSGFGLDQSSDGHGFNYRSPSGYYVIIFPELRDITHVFTTMKYNVSQFGDGAYNVGIEYSQDTTNGSDGTWTPVGLFLAQYVATNPAFRDPYAVAITQAKAVRFYYYPFGDNLGSAPRIGKIHLYGYKSVGETPHRLDFVYPDGSELPQDFDYGDQPRDSTRTWSNVDTFNIGSGLYLRNRSPDKIATDVHLTCNGPSTGMSNDVTLSKDNISYVTQLTWTDIQPLQVVGPIYVRHITADDEVLGVRVARLQVAVGSWV